MPIHLLIETLIIIIQHNRKRSCYYQPLDIDDEKILLQANLTTVLNLSLYSIAPLGHNVNMKYYKHKSGSGKPDQSLEKVHIRNMVFIHSGSDH